MRGCVAIYVEALDLTPEEVQRRGDAADALFRDWCAGLLPPSMSDVLPTARTTLQADYVCVLVWCRSYHHQAPRPGFIAGA
jgi:hypothetical protein